MSEAGYEQKYVKEAFDTNWVVPMGPNVNAFEQNLADFANGKKDASTGAVQAGALDGMPYQIDRIMAIADKYGIPVVEDAAGVIHAVSSATTDCQPNENVEALRVFMLSKKIEARPVWKPMHCQPVYRAMNCATYTRRVEEDIFKVGFCLPAGPYVTDEDVRYIVECIREAIG